MNKLTLTVLSPVSHQNEVFNNLIEVRRHDTGEVGTLLCSHCCKWPSELKDKATWLEGCYTPATMRGDARLLMGYHPQAITRWEIDGEVLTLEVKDINGGEDIETEVIIEDAPVFYPLYQHFEEWEDLPQGRLLKRYWREMVERPNPERPDVTDRIKAFFRHLTGMANNGIIPLWVVSGLADFREISHAFQVIEYQFEEYFNINGDQDRWANVPTDGMEIYADAIVVVNGDDTQCPAIDIDSNIGDDSLIHQLIRELLPDCLVWRDLNSTSCEIASPKGKRCIAKVHEDSSLLIYTMKQKLIAEHRDGKWIKHVN